MGLEVQYQMSKLYKSASALHKETMWPSCRLQVISAHGTFLTDAIKGIAADHVRFALLCLDVLNGKHGGNAPMNEGAHSIVEGAQLHKRRPKTTSIERSQCGEGHLKQVVHRCSVTSPYC